MRTSSNYIHQNKKIFFFCFLRNSPQWARASSFRRFLDHTQRRITVGRTSLNEWSARRRNLYLTIHNTHNRQPSMPPVGFEPTISAGERPQTYALDRAATGTGRIKRQQVLNQRWLKISALQMTAFWWHPAGWYYVPTFRRNPMTVGCPKSTVPPCERQITEDSNIHSHISQDV